MKLVNYDPAITSAVSADIVRFGVQNWYLEMSAGEARRLAKHLVAVANEAEQLNENNTE